ncbi:hypothetical protein [Dehalogenimonas formicexedens]|nr:hypothetical protein [Dehalogenimonas formicexedens]
MAPQQVQSQNVVPPVASAPPIIPAHPVTTVPVPPTAGPIYINSSPPVYREKNKSIPIVILSIFLVLAIIGAGFLGFQWTNTKTNLTNENNSLQSSITAFQSEITSLNGSITTLTNDKTNLNYTITSLQGSVASLNTNLAAIQAKYPLKNFGSFSALQSWVSAHIQPGSSSANVFYQHALNVQTAAMNDGYFISACLYEYANGYYYVWCEAMVGTTAYWWDPEVGTVYLDLSNVHS